SAASSSRPASAGGGSRSSPEAFGSTDAAGLEPPRESGAVASRQQQFSVPRDAFGIWVEVEVKRNVGSLSRRLVDAQLLAWLMNVRAAQNRSGGRRQAHLQSQLQDGTALPQLCRDVINSFVGDQSGVGVTADGLRGRANTVRLQDLCEGLFLDLQKVASQGIMSFHLNQNIKTITSWRPWMLEPDSPQWVRSCLESRGFRVDVCKVYHTAYAGVQGCSFFELKVSW
ncbi:unnamed protein product, partial [Polarella glacialis]